MTRLPRAGEPLRRSRLSREVRDRLLAWISEGRFAPNDMLPSQQELMRQFAVGRPAVREAIQDLQRMGMVELTPGEGARVAEPSARAVLDQIDATARHLLTKGAHALEHLKGARIFFELGMVRIAASRATEAQVAALAVRIAEQEACGADFEAFMNADIAFHGQIAGIAGNPIFVAVSEAMLHWLADYHVGLIRKLGREAQTLREHREVLAGIAAHDPEAAAAAMMAHLKRASDLYLDEGRDAP